MKRAIRAGSLLVLLPLLAGAAIAAAVSLAGCSTTPPPVSTHNLERPSDMAFACVGLLNLPADGGAADAGTADAGTADGSASTPVVSGRPMYECNRPGWFDEPFDVSRRTFSFVANSARGELSVIDLNNSKLVDLDLANPETNVAPLGVLPEQMSASSDGCRIVTANRGSCDLTLVDVGTLMAPILAAEANETVMTTARSTVSQEIVVRGGTTGTPLRVSPQEIMFLPQDTSAITATQNLCSSRPFADPIGWNATPTQPIETQWKALVTFPTCNLIALIDLPSGNIVDSFKVNVGSNGVSVVLQPTGADPACPVDDFCDDHGPDAGAPAGTTVPSAATAVSNDPFVNPVGTRPSSLAILPGGERVYVGLAQASFVVALDVQPNHLAIPSTGGSILLHEGALGVNGVRLSVDPYKGTDPTGTNGRLGGFVGDSDQNQRQYLYVVARDGTVRVVDVGVRTRLLPETECDTNVDPRFVPIASTDLTVPDRSNVCWPTDPPDLAHRRPLARGPGIRLPTIPRDVAFADLTLNNHLEAVVDGSYAFILTSNGVVYLGNVDPTLRTQYINTATGKPVDSPVPEVQPLVSSLRDQNMLTYTTTLDPTQGPARLDLPPTLPAQGPVIEGITTTSPDDNATIFPVPPDPEHGAPVPTYVFFPQQVCSRSTKNPPVPCDPSPPPGTPPMMAPQRQTWNLTWEGDVFGPSFSGQFAVDGSGVTTLVDVGVDFCQAGALPGDFVTIFGCTVDQQCGPLQVCRRSDTAPETAGTLPIDGLCAPMDPAQQAQQLVDCAPLLNSVRRYEILDATDVPGAPSQLTLQPKIDEIASASLSGCTPGTPGMPSTCGPASDPTRAPFTCEAVGSAQDHRCVEACKSDADCRSGRSCVIFPNVVPTVSMKPGLCADGPMLTPDLITKCGLGQLTAYKLGAGTSFLVQGNATTPYVPGNVNATTFSCEPNPARLDRIPYFQTANGVRTPLASCGLDPIPPLDPANLQASTDAQQAKLLTLAHTTPIPSPCLVGTALTAASPTEPPKPPLRVLFQNREIRFVLANVDAYLGDEEQITFDVHGGFQADTVVMPTDIDIDMPIRIMVGPVDSQTQAADMMMTHELPFLFVVDQRRLGRASAGVGPTRGQVLRINPRRATTANANSLVPIYDDPTSTNNLWPIQ